jgi:hypothetical protein
VRKRFENQKAAVVFQRIQNTSATLSFARNQTQLDLKNAEVLDLIGQDLQTFSSLRAQINAGSDSNERDGIAAQRYQVITTYLLEKWRVAPERFETAPAAQQRRQAIITLLPATLKADR